MNKKMIYFSVVAGITAITAMNVDLGMQKNTLSSVAMKNIEALAREGAIGYHCWQTISAEVGATLLHEKTYCFTCTAIPATSWEYENLCIK